MSQPKIGFIGLGLMGFAMVERLLDKGYDLTVVANRSRPNIDAAVARGATEAATPKEMAENSDIIMLCLDTSASVESRVRGDDGILAGLKPGAVIIDFGTSLPESTRTLGAEVIAAGGQYLDGPLGRTPQHARDGLLNIMAAGDKATFDAIEPTLKDLGENVFHLGELGSGHTIKLMNNFLGMATANAMSEVFAMSDVAGIPRDLVYDVMAAGPLRSGMMDFVKGYAVDNDPSQLAFSVGNATKDVNYYNQMVSDAGATSAIAPALSAALNDAVDKGHGDKMVSELVEFYVARLANKG